MATAPRNFPRPGKSGIPKVPVQTPLTDANGNVSPCWTLFFQAYEKEIEELRQYIVWGDEGGTATVAAAGGLRVATFVMGNPTVGAATNLLPIPPDYLGNCVTCLAVPDAAPTADFVVDIVRYPTTAGVPGASASLFGTSKPTMPNGSANLQTLNTFAASPQPINPDDLLQAVIVSSDGTTTGTLVLMWSS